MAWIAPMVALLRRLPAAGASGSDEAPRSGPREPAPARDNLSASTHPSPSSYPSRLPSVEAIDGEHARGDPDGRCFAVPRWFLAAEAAGQRGGGAVQEAGPNGAPSPA